MWDGRVPLLPIAPPRDAASLLGRSAAVAATSAVLGGLTSFGQTVLPDAVSSFANSASGWTLLTVLVVAAARVGTAASGVLGATSFLAIVLGYQTTSVLRGFQDSEELFLVVAVVVGPFVGIAAAWLRRRGVHAALAVALLAGIALGEAAYGLTVVAASTSPVYWVLIGGAGIVLLLVVCVGRLDSVAHRALAAGLAFVTAVAFLGAYGGVGLIAI